MPSEEIVVPAIKMGKTDEEKRWETGSQIKLEEPARCELRLYFYSFSATSPLVSALCLLIHKKILV